ncbi:uncharacterized protein GGS22DRAFT_162758 [Annulohypoxylon maeteangense]|uniref:uncharacterized protein n=1 Tax=Annulohypoxylon maeteangense TaxID=1927788 RepID=UPI002007C91D|nr:uncharacterized protein GGS22DRAFT_162758 [Annulohypoxylon maeteangense]KAI0885095.1 hypothetical protein GGS22DRAFT_162758 [Annulohypoxylon maeteangense]
MATAPHPRSSLRRTACDRCRHSKLKCFRDENQRKCARCLRLELRCEVAPAKPPGRPRKAPPLAPAVVAESTDNIDVISPQFLENGTQSSADEEPQYSLSQTQNPDGLEPGAFGQTPLASHNNINGFILALMPPIPDLKAPEWYETSRFDAGFAPSRDPLEVHSLFTVKLDRQECLKELSQLNVDLDVLVQAVKKLEDDGKLNFAAFCSHFPPPAGDGVSFAEKFLIMSQRFQQAITNLSWVVKNDPKPLQNTTSIIGDSDLPLDPLLNITGPLPTPLTQHEETSPPTPENRTYDQGELLETPFACLLVSCYVQLIMLWEKMWFHVRKRTSGSDLSELTLSDPSKGVQMGAFYIFSGRLQSMFFCQAVLYFLDNIDRGLSIHPEQRAQGVRGLLSRSQHFELLQRELGGEVSAGESERVRVLKETVEKTRVFTLNDVGCSLFRS